MTHFCRSYRKKHLHGAVLRGNREEADVLLNTGHDPNGRRFIFSPRDYQIPAKFPFLPNATPLHLAVLVNDLPMARMLVAAGADVDAVCGRPFFLNPLELAATLRRKYMMHFLLVEGAKLSSSSDLNSHKEIAHQEMLILLKDYYKPSDPFLHEYCLQPDIDEKMVRDLMAFGLDVDTVNESHETLLHRFLRQCHVYGDTELVMQRITFLISLGPNLAIVDIEGNTPLMMALMGKIIFALPFLVSLIPGGTPIDPVNGYGYTTMALTLSRYSGDPFVKPFLHQLRANGAVLSHKSFDGKNLLYFIRDQFSVLPITEYFLENGLESDVDDFKQSLERSELNLAHLLLKYTRGPVREHVPSALQLLITNVRKEKEMVNPILELLLNRFSFDVKSCSSCLINGLLNSIEAYSSITTYRQPNDWALPVIDTLLANGVLPTVEHLIRCVKLSELKIVLLLLDCGRDRGWNLRDTFPDALQSVAAYCFKDKDMLLPIFKRLLDSFAFDSNCVDHFSCTLLHVLIENNHLTSDITILDACIDHLLAIDEIDVDRAPDGFPSPLMYALRHGRYRIAIKLINRFAEIGEDRINLKGVSFNPGMSRVLHILYFAGYRFPDNVCNDFDLVWDSSEEVNHFKLWLQERKREVLSLQQMAGIVIRKVFGKKTANILNRFAFPNTVLSMFQFDTESP